MKTVAELMSTNPLVLGPESRIQDAWKLMHDKRVRHIPICKGKEMVGLVTQKDLLVNSGNTSLLTLPVAEVMVFSVTTVQKDADAALAAQMMLDERISCLPVIEGNQLVGIITESDFLDRLIELLKK